MSIFNIQATPPTSDGIRAARLKILLRGACSIGLMAVLSGGVCFYINDQRPGGPVELLVGWALIMLVGMAGIVNGFLDDFRDLSDDRCKDFHKLCLSTPEGQAYHTAVLEQARKFTNGEFDAMELWAEGSDRREACQKLYDIPA